MAQLQLQTANHGKSKRAFTPSLRVDMTPMVDLGFLLITFFIVTTTMAENKAADLVVPKDGTPMPVKTSRSVTLLLGENEKAFGYTGAWNKNGEHPTVIAFDFLNKQKLRNWIHQKQLALGLQKDELMIVIKPTEKSSYQSFIDVLDEVMINDVKRYAVTEATKDEAVYVSTH